MAIKGSSQLIKSVSWLLLLLVSGSSSFGQLPSGVDVPMIEDLFIRPQMRQVVISRTGKYIATVNEAGGQERILIKNLEDGTEKTISTAEDNDLGQLLTFGGTDTVLFYTQTYRRQKSELVVYDLEGEFFSIDRESRATPGVIQSVDQALFNNVVDTWDANERYVISEVRRNSMVSAYHYDTKRKQMKRVMRGPKDAVLMFYTSKDGLPKVAVTANRRNYHAGMSKTERGQERTFIRIGKKDDWEPLPYFDNDFSAYDKLYDTKEPVAMSPDGKFLYYAQTNSSGTRGLYSFNLETREPVEEIASDPNFDLFEIGQSTWRSGRLYFSAKDSRLLGYLSNRILPKTMWVDPIFRGIQTALDKVLPDQYINQITSWSFDETKFIIYSYSDSDFGAYYLFDSKKKSLDLIGRRSPSLKQEDCGSELVLQIPLRDGRNMLAYLRLPVGVQSPKDLAAVIQIPSAIHNRFSWGNTISEQVYSTRGIATVNLNTRGTSGFGRGHFEEGFVDGGAKIAEDILDAVSFLTQKNILNPEKIVIEGNALSSLFSLQALAKSPESFLAAVIFRPISDLDDYEQVTARRARRFVRWSYVEEVQGAWSRSTDCFDLDTALEAIQDPVRVFSLRGSARFSDDTSPFPTRDVFYAEKYAVEMDSKLKALGKDSQSYIYESRFEEYGSDRMNSTIQKYEATVQFLKDQFGGNLSYSP